ncbi:MAG: DNRLRE domain-containing protein [Phycisphaerales bacterium]
MNRSISGLASSLAVGIIATWGPAAAGQTVALEPVADNTLYEDPSGSLSNGAGQHLFVGRTGDGTRRRGLLRFDVAAAVPAGATVTSAELRLYMSRTQAGPQNVGVHRAAADWGEGTSNAPGQEGGGAPASPGDATWIHTFSPGELWATAGGAFDTAASATQSVAGNGTYGFTSAALAADVQAWLDAPAGNFGWLLLGNEASGSTAKRFDSRENSFVDRRPQLVITYETDLPPTFTYFQDADGDGFGDPAVSIETTDPVPPAGFVADDTDCDDMNPDVNPGMPEICENGIDDNCDGVTDCGVDCNGNGICDLEDIASGVAFDCDANGVPDACDLAAGTLTDGNANGIPDTCEAPCCDGFEPRALLMRYVAETCAGTSHGQDPDDVECFDFAPPPTTAFILATDDEDPFDPDADTWFSGVVDAGSLYLIDAANNGDFELDSRTHIHIFDASGTVLVQSVEFRTQCEDPLSVGDQFGASLIVDCGGGPTPVGPTCLTDLDGDGMTGLTDVLEVLSQWSGFGNGDVDCDGTVGFTDLLGVISQWGPC